MKKGKAEYRVGVGASSIVMMLVVLALTAMSLLALSSAQNTSKLISRSETMTLGYYQAADEAQRRLAAMDQTLFELRAQPSITQSEFENTLKQNKDFGIAIDADGITFSFECDAGESRALLVQGTVSGLAETGARYTLQKHALIDLGVENIEDPYLNLIGEADGTDR